MPRILDSIVAASASLLLMALPGQAGDDDEIGVTPSPTFPEVVVGGEEQVPGDTPTTPIVDGDPPQFETALSVNCSGAGPNDFDAVCPGAFNCPQVGDMSFILWIRELPDGTWTPNGTECRSPDDTEVPRPVVTPDLVLREVRRIGLPALQVQVQPAGATLVNFDTIFYAEPQPFAQTVGLLGYSVDVEASPDSYGWSFGDGQGATTEGPGAPYPAEDVVHAYQSADVVAQPSVDVSYEIRFRVDGGQWQSIDETVTAEGPTVDVDVKEAAPALSGN